MSVELQLQEMNERVTQLVYDVAELSADIVLDTQYDSEYVEVVDVLNEFVSFLGRWVHRIPAPISNPRYELVDEEELVEAKLPGSVNLTNVQAMLVNDDRSFSEISNGTGVSRNSLIRIADGETKNPHPKTLRKLEEFFGLEVGDLDG